MLQVDDESHFLPHSTPLSNLRAQPPSERDEGGGGYFFVWFPLLSQEGRRCDGNLILPCLMVDERQSARTRLWHAECAIRYFDDLFIDLVRGLAGEGALLREFTR